MNRKIQLIENVVRKILKEFDYTSLYDMADDPKIDAIIRNQESERLKLQKDRHAKNINAEGKDWNDAFLRRVKTAKKSLDDLKKASYNKRGNWNLLNSYVKEAIEAVEEMKFGAEKYAKYLRQQWERIGGI